MNNITAKGGNMKHVQLKCLLNRQCRWNSDNKDINTRLGKEKYKIKYKWRQKKTTCRRQPTHRLTDIHTQIFQWQTKNVLHKLDWQYLHNVFNYSIWRDTKLFFMSVSPTLHFANHIRCLQAFIFYLFAGSHFTAITSTHNFMQRLF